MQSAIMLRGQRADRPPTRPQAWAPTRTVGSASAALSPGSRERASCTAHVHQHAAPSPGPRPLRSARGRPASVARCPGCDLLGISVLTELTAQRGSVSRVAFLCAQCVVTY